MSEVTLCSCEIPDKEINSLGGIYAWHCKKCGKPGERMNYVGILATPMEPAKREENIGKIINGKLQTTADGSIPLKGELMVFDPERGCVRGRKKEPLTTEKIKEIMEQGVELADKAERKVKQEESFTKVNDSGDRRQTITGAVRDRAQGKGRYDLVSPIGLRRLALHYENGARKYKDRNWEKGMPLSWFLDSAIRHLFSYLAGDRSEDHLAAVAWNAFGYIHIEELIRKGKLPKELDDIGATDRPLIEETNDTGTNETNNSQVQNPV